MPNLTELEQTALDAEINLSDGHPRHDLTTTQLEIIDRLPEFFTEAQEMPFDELELRSQRAFLGSLGQRKAPVLEGRVASVYSSSVATMVVARYLRRNNHRVGLIHPTFDSLAYILAESVPLVPVIQRVVEDLQMETVLRRQVSCLFLTVPNNPNGWILDHDGLRRLAFWAADRRILLCLDTSFRGFDTRVQYDTYEVLEQAGGEYIVIEDTGKLWPISELKLGFLATSRGVQVAIRHSLSDVLLTVSPLVLRLIEALSRDYLRGGSSALHALVANNRAMIAALIAETDQLNLPDPESRVSVCQIGLSSGREASRVEADLRRNGVHVLPSRLFHWAHPIQGDHQLRIAIARNPTLVAEGVRRLREVALNRAGASLPAT